MDGKDNFTQYNTISFSDICYTTMQISVSIIIFRQLWLIVRVWAESLVMQIFSTKFLEAGTFPVIYSVKKQRDSHMCHCITHILVIPLGVHYTLQPTLFFKIKYTSIIIILDFVFFQYSRGNPVSNWHITLAPCLFKSS